MGFVRKNAFGARDWGLILLLLVVEGFFNLEWTVSVLSPSLASPSLPRGGEKRVRVGVGLLGGLGRLVFRTQPRCGSRIGGSFTHRRPTEGRR